MTKLIIRYNDEYETENGIETIPKSISLMLLEENGYFVARFTQEAIADLVALGANHGMNIELRNT